MKRILVAVAAAVVVLAALAAIGWAQVAPTLKPTLEQPLLFPHGIHVRLVNLDCTFCHRGTTQVTPPTAGYPSVEQCMFCHKVVATDRPPIQKLRTAFENKEPIDWVRVYLLPDHAHFLHEPHIRAGFQCTECHGSVADMQQVTQARVIGMGVCVDCHRANNARTDCTICHY